MELVPAVEGWPLYQVTILICLVLSAPNVLSHLTLRSLRARPITVCVLGLFVAVILVIVILRMALSYVGLLDPQKYGIPG